MPETIAPELTSLHRLAVSLAAEYLPAETAHERPLLRLVEGGAGKVDGVETFCSDCARTEFDDG